MDSDSGASTSCRSSEPRKGKTMQDIAYECDDFLTECAPAGRSIDNIQVSKTNLVEDLLHQIEDDFQRYPGRKLDNLENQLRLLDEIFDFHKDSYSTSNLDTLDVNALVEKSKMLGQTIAAVEAVVGVNSAVKSDKIDFKAIKEDFSSCKKILNDTISTVFKEHSKEVTLLLSELLKNEFNENQRGEYLDLSTEQFSDEIVDTLIEMGVVEYHPEDDTQIKLTKLN